ncbi:YihY family inner membrane protein [Desulfovibrio mangrovi]|uniref:YhjD/YihY/BrkB family envelope integrity protein n=1 Tax=Desulfovibrio mangrovi TaxID=2976983 RepID=UPI00224593BC|nr:YhjD/YihY/BrkB family envelope integrity protein [Desulfovibrio mangrovi]UZP65936.1 YihY family inner membrane protein [Desulfovibrio mangrovi]
MTQPTKPQASLKEQTGRIVRFVTRDIWLEDIDPQDRKQQGLAGLLKWLYLVVHGFMKDQCLLRASALTYTTVLSIVPFLAVAFSISKGMGLQNSEGLRAILLNFSAGNEQTVDHILGYVNNTNVGTLGTIGMATLLLTVGSVMGTIEKAFNSIWGVTQGRTMWRKFTDFFSVSLICPIVFGVAFSVSASLKNDTVMQTLLSYSAFSYAYITLLKFIPLLMVTLMLLFLYVFIPNTKVRIPSGFVGALIAATLWKSVENLYVTYQVGAAKYNAIYGGFAQVPLFLVWVYISWVIVLLGVEFSFAMQNVRTFENEIRSDTATREERDKLAALSMLLLTRRFYEHGGPVSLADLSETLRAPVRLIQNVMSIMQKAGMVVQTCGDDPSYALCAPPDSIRFTDIIFALASHRPTSSKRPMTARFGFINHTFRTMYEDTLHSEANMTLKDYCERMLPEGFGGASACLNQPSQPPPTADDAAAS